MKYAIDFMLLEIDTKQKLTKKLGDVELILDNSYTRTQDDYIPEEEYIVNQGKVVGLPAKLPHRSKLFGIDLEIEEGDEVLVHHFACDSTKKCDKDGKDYYFFEYTLDFGSRMSSNVYGVIRDGEVSMVADHNLLKMDTIVEKFGEYENKYPSETKGTVVSVNKMSNVKEGDKVFVNPNSGCELLIDGVSYHVFPNEDVWAVLEGEDS
jgi:co-chaperonin GroES (HSP10)